MSIEFIRDKSRSMSLFKASTQQKRILQYGKSDIQVDNVYTEYLMNYNNRKNMTSDYLSNFIKSVLKTDNFLSVYDFIRKPLASSKICNVDILNAYRRVLHGEDSYFSHTVNGETVVRNLDLMSSYEYEQYIEDLIFRPNDVYITDLKDENKPYTYLLDINSVTNIEDDGKEISKISFKTKKNIDGEYVTVIAYIDKDGYSLYKDDEEFPFEYESHDLGYCPARFVSSTKKDNDFIIRKSILSDVLPELEYYNLLEACNRLVEIKGSFPITVRLEKSKTQVEDLRQALNSDPDNENDIGGQKAEDSSDFTKTEKNKSDVGTEFTLTLEDLEGADNSINTELLKNFITHVHFPVDILKHLKNELRVLRSEIIDSVNGTHNASEKEGSKNKEHLEEKLSHKEDRLRFMSKELTLLVEHIEKTEYNLEYGSENVTVDVFFGSKFFLESEASLLDTIKNSPNPIESREAIERLNKKKNLYNPTKSVKQSILYDLIPYYNKLDFEFAVSNNIATIEDKILQTKFNHYIARFETEESNIVDLMNEYKEDYNTGIQVIKNKLNTYVKNDKEINSTESVQGREQEQ